MTLQSKLSAAADWVRLINRASSHPLNRDRRGRMLLQAIGWQIWKRTIRLPLSVRYWDRTRLWLHPDWPYSSMVVYERLVEYDDLMFVARYLRSGDSFVDVGANIGMYSILAATIAEQVVSYEPHPQAAQRLSENIELNKLTNVHVRAVAVGDSSGGTVDFTAGLYDQNHVVSDKDESSVPSVRVSLTTLDSDVPIDMAPALIKIDTEGFELSVLRGARRLLSTQPAPAVMVELIGLGARYGSDERDAVALLQSLGYRSFRYYADDNRLVPDDRFDPDRGNLIFLRDEPAAIERLSAHRGAARV